MEKVQSPFDTYVAGTCWFSATSYILCTEVFWGVVHFRFIVVFIFVTLVFSLEIDASCTMSDENHDTHIRGIPW